MLLTGLVYINLFLASQVASQSDPADVVDTGYAKYLGNRTFPNAVAYLGIPYAEPPLGDRRFRAPIPLNTTRVAEGAGGEVVDATEYPEFCVQGSIGIGDAGGAGSEDCLKVNIYAPAGAKKGDNLPVLFYIHGGGYVYGNPRNWPFDHWIKQSPNVVVVSVYYRLKAFGFLAIPEFDDPANGDNNAGFLDQIQALRWVKENIASFGGDPNKITINGQSAGGGSVLFHLVANLGGEPLFHGAIAQSVARSVTPDPEQVKPAFDFFASAAGCDAETVVEQLTCLRNASVSALARAQDASFNGTYRNFRPVVDRKVILGHPTTLIKEGSFLKVPLIVGATSNETSGGSSDPATFLRSSFPALTDEDIRDILEAYPEDDFASDQQRRNVIAGESTLICAREIMGEAFAKAPKSWTYRYNQPNPTGNVAAGTTHAAENWMMFLGTNTGVNGSNVFTPMTPVENAFAEELIAYWLSFVRSGDPNTYKLERSPEWTQYSVTDSEDGGSRLRIVLQQDPGNSTTRSGNVLEQEPENQARRCAVVASKSEGEQN
ncbi:hypothetical protein Moror_956 [Moniliophthora roreri MCA 2997]|uniref:Carboxylic ester hydrolase n=1 Tax=Moniliophthora roreri (strain MCA 2997) TaxID=1381753 RepID=V2XQB0_MONRO|nr:hypothetical protein Moror_956 [Moniliophthora roreri MCA 2997]